MAWFYLIVGGLFEVGFTTALRFVDGFRNVLIHGYAVVRHDKTWDILVSELPVLLREVTEMLAHLVP